MNCKYCGHTKEEHETTCDFTSCNECDCIIDHDCMCELEVWQIVQETGTQEGVSSVH